jgi:pantoate--beta-alanine ligase
LEADVSLLAGCGVDVVFAPNVDEVYRPGHATWVDVEAVAEPLEGAFRPGHFRGVATIVLKLFHRVQPDAAFFGQKDFQQVQVIRRMTADLDVPIAIRMCPIVREADGLAMSSRNRYLSPAARKRSRVLSQSLALASTWVAGGERCAAEVERRIRERIETVGDAKIDYVAIVDPETFLPVETITAPTLVALAVRIENTRLIDNCLIEI